jgi:hypothetical protein
MTTRLLPQQINKFDQQPYIIFRSEGGSVYQIEIDRCGFVFISSSVLPDELPWAAQTPVHFLE